MDALHCQLLADMKFSSEDHPIERQLKQDVIKVYNKRLDEREERKRFVLEQNLLDYKKHPGKKRRKVRSLSSPSSLAPLLRRPSYTSSRSCLVGW